MLNISLDKIKQKATDFIDTTTEVINDAAHLAKELGSELTKKTIKTSQELSVSVKDNIMARNVRTKMTDLIDARTESYPNVKKFIKKAETSMKHRVLMLGGRRAGKSTILSSILTQLRENTPGTICTVIDKTDYTQEIANVDGTSMSLPTLDIKQNEIKRYIKKRQRNTEFLVDMTPTFGKASYVLEVSANNTSIELEFVDVPGEWMRANVSEHAQLVSMVETSDVFIIVIDTPFLMNTEDQEGISINSVYNRINEITQALSKMKINSQDDLKQIILCPVKCEKWLREGNEDMVVDKVQTAYRDLINRWVTRPEVTIRIMPIQTVGGLESSRMLPAKLYFKDDDDLTGERCSLDPLNNTLINSTGFIIRSTGNSHIEDDPFWTIDYIDIPLSWYRLNDDGFSPRFCEQPGFHILKFLVEKEENAIRSKAAKEKEKLDERNLIWRWLTKIYNPTFGVYLPIWQNVISQLEGGDYIKTEGDGFCCVTSKID